MTRAPLAALTAALVTTACGAALMRLPQGPGTAAPDGREAFTQATTACHAVTSLTAEAAVSGTIDGQRLRATLNVGFDGDSIRLEAIAYSQPIFVFVADGPTGSLLLQRENRVIENGSAGDILEAVTGVALRSDTLKSTFTGCTVSTAYSEAMQFDDKWRSVPDVDGIVYLTRPKVGAVWSVAAATHQPSSAKEWRAEFRKTANGLPHDIRIRSAARQVDLHLSLSQIETGTPIDARAFRIQVPPSAVPMTIDELRRSGPLGGTASSSGEMRGVEVWADAR
ncbi:MAG TPA: hypothetical protein VJP86_09465 [Vicinamibacterales bacterium]|nr:hypothetical protein [Vicinamibacterales bacterium]